MVAKMEKLHRRHENSHLLGYSGHPVVCILYIRRQISFIFMTVNWTSVAGLILQNRMQVTLWISGLQSRMGLTDEFHLVSGLLREPRHFFFYIISAHYHQRRRWCATEKSQTTNGKKPRRFLYLWPITPEFSLVSTHSKKFGWYILKSNSWQLHVLGMANGGHSEAIQDILKLIWTEIKLKYLVFFSFFSFNYLFSLSVWCSWCLLSVHHLPRRCQPVLKHIRQIKILANGSADDSLTHPTLNP